MICSFFTTGTKIYAKERKEEETTREKKIVILDQILHRGSEILQPWSVLFVVMHGVFY
jgi:hypothetical protein